MSDMEGEETDFDRDGIEIIDEFINVKEHSSEGSDSEDEDMEEEEEEEDEDEELEEEKEEALRFKVENLRKQVLMSYDSLLVDVDIP